MKSSIAKACAMFGAFFLSLSLQRACAQEVPKDDVPSRFQHSLDLFHQKRCQEAWDELWKLAQAKDYYALYILTGSVLGRSLGFTGTTDVKTFVKVYLPMDIYATLTSETIGSPFSIETIRRSIIPATIALDRDLDRSDSKMVVDCFASTEPQEVCVGLAIKRRLIPEYDAYIAAVNLLNKTSLHVECAAAPKEFSIIRKRKD